MGNSELRQDCNVVGRPSSKWSCTGSCTIGALSERWKRTGTARELLPLPALVPSDEGRWLSASFGAVLLKLAATLVWLSLGRFVIPRRGELVERSSAARAMEGAREERREGGAVEADTDGAGSSLAATDQNLSKSSEREASGSDDGTR